MNHDRELLERAAKAAGYSITYDPADGELRAGIEPGWWPKWNPLKSDGDALRLAVKLAITDLAIAVGEYVCSGEYSDGEDICAITRRAIVRKAAELAEKAIA